MTSFYVVVSLVIVSFLFVEIELKPFRLLQTSISQAESTLVLAHVIFRHGNRTPELTELYPKDPYLNYTYYPLGNGQLTNAGKMKEYLIGKQLRQRYNNLLGDYYYPEYVDARSTDYNRTKMSLELVLASLYQPHAEQIWQWGLNWQPIPYNYFPRKRDPELMGTDCPTYVTEYAELNSSPEMLAEYRKYQKVFDYISENSGLNVTIIEDVYNLYFGLATEEEYGFTLPSWVDPVWPDTIADIAVKQYGVYINTTRLAQMASGYLIKKIIADSKIKISSPDRGKRIYLYSAHENNLGQMLLLLNIFYTIEIPTYGSYLSFELHYVNNTYGFKIYYQNYRQDDIQLLKIPTCDDLCPLSTFEDIVAKYIPEDSLCGISL